MVVPTLPTPVPTPVPEERFPCNICGIGTPSNPNAVLFFDPLLGVSITCQQAQVVGTIQGFTVDQCLLSQFLAVGTCGCPNDPPTAAPVPGSTPAPTMAPPTVFCTVCFNGRPSDSNAGSIGGRLCSVLDQEGRNDEFTLEECLIVQTAAAVAADDPCECAPSPSP